MVLRWVEDPIEPLESISALGDDRSDDDAICEPPQLLRGCRRVNSSPWAGNSPKQVRGAFGRK